MYVQRTLNIPKDFEEGLLIIQNSLFSKIFLQVSLPAPQEKVIVEISKEAENTRSISNLHLGLTYFQNMIYFSGNNLFSVVNAFDRYFQV